MPRQLGRLPPSTSGCTSMPACMPPSTSGCPLQGAYEDRQAVHLVMDLCSGGELFDRWGPACPPFAYLPARLHVCPPACRCRSPVIANQL